MGNTSGATRTHHRYGKHPSQVGDLWRPGSKAVDVPVVVLVHGGFWKFPYTKRLMNGLAMSMVERGLAVWNIEYRRVGLSRSGWPAVFDDVEAALGHLRRLEGLALDHVVTCGHSAGGHLALWLAATKRSRAGQPAEQVPVKGVVSLAGVADLVAAADLGLGNGAACRLMGGPPSEVPERYRSGSPVEMLPLGVPQVLVHGLADTVVPASMSQGYSRQAIAAGDQATYVPLEGVGHRELIDPRSAAWAAALSHVERLI